MGLRFQMSDRFIRESDLSSQQVSEIGELNPPQYNLQMAEFHITVIWDGPHPDDTIELQRVLAPSRYGFKVEEEGISEIGPDYSLCYTKFLIRFAVQPFFGRTRNGGLKAVVKAIDEVLDKSSHDRDFKLIISREANRRTITFERWLRPRTTKQPWTRDHRLAVGILIFGAVGAVAALAAVLTIPEVRRFLRLDKPEATQQVQPEKPTPTT